jgi:hypothetical protein
MFAGLSTRIAGYLHRSWSTLCFYPMGRVQSCSVRPEMGIYKVLFDWN